METTPFLKLPKIAAAQAQKHVTHNEALLQIDALVHLSVIDRDLAAPPPAPAEGARYIVGNGATGAWSGQSGRIALYQDAAWQYLVPNPGWRAYVEDEQILMIFTAGGWVNAFSGALQNVTQIGINATADAQNRLSVASASSQFFNTGGGHQLKIGKATASGTASLVFQNDFSGRAELGLAGNDRLSFKVSADGANWLNALVIDQETGLVSMPQNGGLSGQNLLINGDFQINQRCFAGGALAVGVFGHDRMRAFAGGANYSVTGMTVNHASGLLVQTVEPDLWRQASFALQRFTFSVSNLAGGNLTVQIGSASGVITPGSGRRSVTLVTAAGDNGPLPVRWGPAGAAVSYQQVQIETGAVASVFRQRPLSVEMELCRRYFTKSYDMAVSPGQAAATAGQIYRRQYVDFPNDGLRFPTAMRATPTVSIFSPVTGASGQCRISGSDAPVTTTGVSASGFYFYTSAAQSLANRDLTWHFSADAEIP